MFCITTCDSLAVFFVWIGQIRCWGKSLRPVLLTACSMCILLSTIAHAYMRGTSTINGRGYGVDVLKRGCNSAMLRQRCDTWDMAISKSGLKSNARPTAASKITYGKYLARRFEVAALELRYELDCGCAAVS